MTRHRGAPYLGRKSAYLAVFFWLKFLYAPTRQHELPLNLNGRLLVKLGPTGFAYIRFL